MAADKKVNFATMNLISELDQEFRTSNFFSCGFRNQLKQHNDTFKGKFWIPVKWVKLTILLLMTVLALLEV